MEAGQMNRGSYQEGLQQLKVRIDEKNQEKSNQLYLVNTSYENLTSLKKEKESLIGVKNVLNNVRSTLEKVSTELRSCSNSLQQGLTIDGVSVDEGKIEEKSVEMKTITSKTTAKYLDICRRIDKLTNVIAEEQSNYDIYLEKLGRINSELNELKRLYLNMGGVL